ncbi:alpha/beta fold hydrolase [Nocardioides bruguierae]|uniref:Alpha/beta fold hydrolase n=1 Tax=Nocardioides bruguierae TaxID=2945102 RepID=A0A9X2D620_9ACTN|nr:alpha/beta fold hydrolase [Nocardioides bruguierae]MCM0619833.1 alpha/beta fold hydrolase [Nocardioides bruguierae]
MDLLPSLGQLSTAATTLGRLAVRRGLADLTPQPATVLLGTDDGGVLVRHDGASPTGPAAGGAPVVLVGPPAAPGRVYDLRRGCSLVEHLLGTGRTTFLVELPEPLDPRVDLLERLPAVAACVRAAARASGIGTVHLLGWGLGGALGVLAAASQDLPLASLTTLGTPWSLDAVPLSVPARPLLDSSAGAVRLGWRVTTGVGSAVPGARAALESRLVDTVVGAPLTAASRLDDPTYLAQLEAVEALRRDASASIARAGLAEHEYAGRTYGQAYHRLLGPLVREGDTTVSPATVRVPTLAVAGATDAIVSPEAVRSLVDALTGAPEARWEIVPGGHLGQLTGRGAATGTWPVLDEWFAAHDAATPPASGRARGRRPRAATTKKAAKKTTTKTTTKATASASADRIGSNPTRRYSSSSSRDLAPGSRD